ncbi:MAG: FliG C-terminal domain-containing protein, partial [Planctomycetaceae bacterium]
SLPNRPGVLPQPDNASTGASSILVEVLVPGPQTAQAVSDGRGVAPVEAERIIKTVKNVLPIGAHAEIRVHVKPPLLLAEISSSETEATDMSPFLSGLLLAVMLFAGVFMFRRRSATPTDPSAVATVSVPDSSDTDATLTEPAELLASHPSLEEDIFPLTPTVCTATSTPEEPSGPQQIATPRPRFAYLRQTEPRDLHRLLAGEHPQTVALVLRHVPTKQATDVVSLLPANIQSQVIRRIAEADLSDVEVVEELEQTLKTRFTKKLPTTATVESVHLQSPLNPLAQFEEIVQLSQPNLKRVVEEVEESLWVQALHGASETLRFRVIAVLPPQHARSVRSQLSRSVPQATDVETTRNRIVETVNALGLPDNSQPLRHEFVA